MSKREQPEAASKAAVPDENTEFTRVLDKHLQALKWNPDNLKRGSTRYPMTDEAEKALAASHLGTENLINFKAGISRPQAYGILAKKSAGDWRPPSRSMINLIAHELSAHYEDANSKLYGRQNVEVLLEELLRAAGFASHQWANDLWDEIIDAPRQEGVARDNESGRAVRVGYFTWPGMAKLTVNAGSIVAVEGKSAEMVNWLLRALRLPTAHEQVPLSVPDLYDRGLFMRVDLVAPLVGVPARRFAMGYSDAIGGWRVGQNLLVNQTHFAAVAGNEQLTSHHQIPVSKLRFCYVRGGVSELLVDELEVPDSARVPYLAFQDAIDQVAVHPEIQDGRCPCFVGDAVSCHTAMQMSAGTLKEVLNDNLTMACPLVFGLPQRPEVIATVNQALDLLVTLRRDQFNGLIPNGINRYDWDKHLNDINTQTKSKS